MKWKIYGEGVPPLYFVPDTEKILLLKNCKLHNNRRVSEQIFSGAHKTACAWIVFDSYEETSLPSGLPLVQVRFNPRQNPFWVLSGENVDGSVFPELVVIGSKIFKIDL